MKSYGKMASTGFCRISFHHQQYQVGGCILSAGGPPESPLRIPGPPDPTPAPWFRVNEPGFCGAFWVFFFLSNPRWELAIFESGNRIKNLGMLRNLVSFCWLVCNKITLMASRWFGSRWFGIRILAPLSNNPFHKGIPGIQTTGPENHQLTMNKKNANTTTTHLCNQKGLQSPGFWC